MSVELELVLDKLVELLSVAACTQGTMSSNRIKLNNITFFFIFPSVFIVIQDLIISPSGRNISQGVPDFLYLAKPHPAKEDISITILPEYIIFTSRSAAKY